MTVQVTWQITGFGFKSSARSNRVSVKWTGTWLHWSSASLFSSSSRSTQLVRWTHTHTLTKAWTTDITYNIYYVLCSTEGFEEYAVDRCVFNSTKPDDIQYIYSHYYNKREYVRFDSRVGEYVGYTEYGVSNAKRWNEGPEVIQRRTAKERYCVYNVGIDYNAALTKSGECLCDLIIIIIIISPSTNWSHFTAETLVIIIIIIIVNSSILIHNNNTIESWSVDCHAFWGHEPMVPSAVQTLLLLLLLFFFYLFFKTNQTGQRWTQITVHIDVCVNK